MNRICVSWFRAEKRAIYKEREALFGPRQPEFGSSDAAERSESRALRAIL
jgi:hypothetical protein